MKKLMSFLLLFTTLIGTANADLVRIVDDGEQAYQLRMNLIENAKEEIDISYFIFAEDKTALEMLSLLRKKAREGVKVRILIDALFNSIPKDIGTHLQQENVLIKNFNTFNLFRLGRTFKYRMHDKMFIVDQKKIIMGGRNVEDTYYAKAPKNFDDRDVYVVGDLAQEASQYFDEIWNADHVKPFKQIKLKDNKANEELDQVEASFFMKNSTASFNLEAFESELSQVENVELFHDIVPAKVKKKTEGTASRLYDLIRNAKTSVIIDSPYLVFSKELKQLFKETIARGVTIRFLTNSLKSTDGIFPQAAYIGQRKNIVEMGIELYEYFDKDCLHSKSLVVDGKIAAIGSFNFDPRSQNLNTETMAVIHDSKIAALLKQSMDASLNLSYKINEKGLPEGHDEKLPGVSTKKRIITRLIQFLIVPWTKGLL
jgi:cardiolipin synthase C